MVVIRVIAALVLVILLAVRRQGGEGFVLPIFSLSLSLDVALRAPGALPFSLSVGIWGGGRGPTDDLLPFLMLTVGGGRWRGCRGP